MNNSIIQDRLNEFNPTTVEEQNNVLKEIVQEIILYGLSTINFFEKALFQGGTALRILYGLPRFSEDMDFIVKDPKDEFHWQIYIEGIESICEEYGIITKVTDKSKTKSSIQRLFIKNDSIGKMLDLGFKHSSYANILIKLEIDVNPPLGSNQETKYLDFPLLHAIQAQDLTSNFAGKCHALLCRKYTKGRDWYDFLWYVAKNISPNLHFLQNAINQTGPWESQKIEVTPQWFIRKLKEKIQSVKWDDAANDVERFLNEKDRKQLTLWCNQLFLDRADKLETRL
jgi:predicted nucleotidyltransferase component of viral defense system